MIPQKTFKSKKKSRLNGKIMIATKETYDKINTEISGPR